MLGSVGELSNGDQLWGNIMVEVELYMRDSDSRTLELVDDGDTKDHGWCIQIKIFENR